MNKKAMMIIALLSAAILSGCSNTRTTETPPTITPIATQEPTPTTELYLGQQTDPKIQKEKLCGSIDKSDIIIELSFADGIEKDSSYETGFYYSPIMSNMKLARRDCDYRIGFSFAEMKNKGAVEVGVRGYSDNVRRKLEGEPHSVVFDKDGKPNIALPIKVKVLN